MLKNNFASKRGRRQFYSNMDSVQESEQARICTGCRHPGSWNGCAHLEPGKQRNSSVYRPFNKIFAKQGAE
jgi:hypothetical protein